MILFLKNFQSLIIIKHVGLWIKTARYFLPSQCLDNSSPNQQLANMLFNGKMKELGHFSTSCGEAVMVKNTFSSVRDNVGLTLA
jgi:hypothetical protein